MNQDQDAFLVYTCPVPTSTIIIIMEICKAPTLRLKALIKHNVTHMRYIKMENVISNLTKSEHIM